MICDDAFGKLVFYWKLCYKNSEEQKMTLFDELQKVSSEEDVKDLYIKALRLKGYQPRGI